MPVGGVLFRGHIMHLRLAERRHRFRYRAFSLMLDLDALPRLRLLGIDRPGLMSFWQKDHGPRDGTDLRTWVDARLAAAGVAPAERVYLHAFPRVLGYVFNPLSVYFCYAGGRLHALIYQVRNTYGDQVAYVLPAGDAPDGRYRQTQQKSMYVSPFVDMEETYRFTLTDPCATADTRLALRIRQGGAEGETLIAAHTAKGDALTDRRLLAALCAYPAFTVAVIALIHWNALRLWLKGVGWRRYAPARAYR